MAHWRSMVGERRFFDVADLGGKDLLVQVESARPGVVSAVINGKKQDTRAVLVKFVGHERPLAFKATLAKAFVSLHGTGDIDQWAGRWLWLTSAMVPDPSGGRGALCEAVRIRPGLPTERDIANARGKSAPSKQNEPSPAVSSLVSEVCTAIGLAGDEQAIEAAIAPHRDELRQLDERHRTIVASAKRARLAMLAAPQEGTAQ